MRILLLGDSDSPHIIKWAKAINKSGIYVIIYSFYKPDKLLYNESPEIKIYSLGLSRNLQMKESKDLSKTVYFKAIKQVKEIIKLLKPDILHAHYASSYGLIGALTGFHPYIISVWGADIYHFPNYSFIHKGIIKYNLQKADKILSTSKVMKEEIKKYTHKEI